jgi:hypothetical protein
VRRFFCFWATLIALQLYSASLYRLLGTTLRSIVFGTSVAVVVMLLTMLGSGFLLLQDQIPGWLNWLFWVSPLQYAFTGLANNEYSGKSYDRLVPVEDGLRRLGDVVMQQYQMNIADKYRRVPLPLHNMHCNFSQEIMRHRAEENSFSHILRKLLQKHLLALESSHNSTDNCV